MFRILKFLVKLGRNMENKDLKSSIRKSVLEKRKKVNIAQESNKIYQNFIKSKYYDKANSIMSYMNINTETETGSINKEILDDDKTLLLPVLINNEIKVSKYTFEDTFKVGIFNIPEPSPFREYDKQWVDVLLVPGVAFSPKTGHRLGYGKGFFDRFLKDFKGTKIGLCFEEQLVEDIPFEPQDITMDALVTENRIIEIKK